MYALKSGWETCVKWSGVSHPTNAMTTRNVVGGAVTNPDRACPRAKCSANVCGFGSVTPWMCETTTRAKPRTTGTRLMASTRRDLMTAKHQRIRMRETNSNQWPFGRGRSANLSEPPNSSEEIIA